MKSLLILTLLSIVLIFGANEVYADTIKLTTDKMTYTSNDEFVIVTGQLDKFTERNYTYIQLFPPNDENYLMKKEGHLDSNANFSVEFSISELEVSGTIELGKFGR